MLFEAKMPENQITPVVIRKKTVFSTVPINYQFRHIPIPIYKTSW